MHKHVLLVNDMSAYGKVALSAMIPVLAHVGVNSSYLPTALASNTVDYGNYHILDTTDFMKESLRVWKELGFSFDAIATGYITNATQAEIVRDYCCDQASKGIPVFCDPVLGDNGELYPGKTEKDVENMRNLAVCASVLIPNYTEAALLAGEQYLDNPSAQDIRRIIDKLRELGPKSIVMTSVRVDGVYQVCCYDGETDHYFNLPINSIPVHFPGTGDIFAAMLVGNYLNGQGMETSVARAMLGVRAVIAENQDQADKFGGVPIESCLEVLEDFRGILDD